ncbi:hypothetical protein pipiens_017544, partial [Culex pipiens pipiens]
NHIIETIPNRPQWVRRTSWAWTSFRANPPTSGRRFWRNLLARIFILNFFGCAACTHAAGDKTLISLAFGLSVFMVVM